jgi:hypothetical protein
METPSTPKSTTANKPTYVGKVESTGDTWTDVRQATEVQLHCEYVMWCLTGIVVQRLSFSDFSRIGEMPCVRSSLLTGIASGFGVGVIRGVSAREFVCGVG